MTTCVTWKQPDGNHFHGLCTNRFRMTASPAGVDADYACELCVHPVDVSPPIGCNGCADLPETQGNWPVAYTIRGGNMTGTGTASGIYNYSSDNATATITRTNFVHDFSWDDIGSIFNGGRLVRTQTSPTSPQCYWAAQMREISTYRFRSYVNLSSSAGTCFVARNLPELMDLASVVKRENGPQICRKTSEGTAYMQLLLLNALYDTSSGVTTYTPGMAGLYPAGYGDLSGTAIRAGVVSGIGGNTNTQVFPDCPGIATYAGVGLTKELRFELVPDTPAPGQMTMNVNVTTNRFQFSTYFRKSNSRWEPGIGAGYPPSPPNTHADPPYGASYVGTVDCEKKNYIKMTKKVTPADPLGYYPPSIELIGD